MTIKNPMLALAVLLSGPTLSYGVEQTTTTSPPQSTIQGTLPAFPPSDKCSTSAPCRNVAGEIVKIEESYWIQQPDGTQTHIRVKSDTKIESRVKVGDSIAAQVTSSGDAEAVLKLGSTPHSTELTVPAKELGDLR